MKKCLYIGILLTLLTPLTTSRAAELPDLIVSAASFNRSIQSLNATVRNEGPGALSPTEKFVVTFTLFDTAGARLGSSITQPTPSIYQGLTSGRGITITGTTNNQLTDDQVAKVASVQAKVRLLGGVAEASVDNNEKITAVAGARPADQVDLADLIVQSATLNRATGLSQVYVLNQGRLDLMERNSYFVSVEYLDDSGSVVTTRTDGGPSSYGLPKQHSEQLDDFLKLSQAEINRVARVRATARMANGQTEADTTNNTLEVDVPGEHGLPDLIVPAASFSRSSRFTSVSIKNVGSITVPANTGVTIRIEYLDDAGSVVTTAGGSHMSAMTPNSNGYPIQRITPQPSVEQAERIASVRVVVDPSNRIEESNEDNNVYPVPPTPPVVTPPDDAVVPEETSDTVDDRTEAREEVGILPTSRLYVLKRLARTVRSAVTFNKEKKADLHRQYAKEVLAETRAVQLSASEEVMKKQLARYKKEVETIEAIAAAVEKKDTKLAERLTETLASDLKVHQNVLDSIERSIPLANTGINEFVREEIRKTIETIVVRLEEKKAEENFEQQGEELKLEEQVTKRLDPTEPVGETKTGASIQMSLGEGIIRVESADPGIVKGRQVEFPVILQRSNIADLQFDIEYNSALLSFNKQSGAEHSFGAVIEPLNVTSQATVSTQLAAGRATIHIAGKGPLLSLGGPLSIAKLRFTILGMANQEIVVTPKNVIATDADGVRIPVTVSAGKVRVIAPAPLSCEKEIFAPVCGVDEKTYDNACEAKKAGVVVRTLEPCKADQVSTETYPSIVEMRLTANGFSPMVIDIAAGGTIVFINNDEVSHILVRNETKTERIDPGMKATMALPNNRAIYTIESEQVPSFAATVVVH